MTQINFTVIHEALGNVEATEAIRKTITPRTVFSEERQMLALRLARDAHAAKDFATAEVWALRALNDGPSIAALALLGDVCQDTGDLENAVRWYEQACACEPRRFDPPTTPAFSRFGRLRSLRRELREDWAARAPVREVNFLPNWTSNAGVIISNSALLGWANEFLKHVVLDDDLDFISLEHDLKLPPTDEQVPMMWVLPVTMAPSGGARVQRVGAGPAFSQFGAVIRSTLAAYGA